MGKYWKLVNVDKKLMVPQPCVRITTQVCEKMAPQVFCAKMAKILSSRDGRHILGAMTVPDLEVVLASQSELTRTRAHNLSSRLVSLPQEILDAITIDLSQPVDILSLALTCSYFWRVLLPQVKEAICTIKAPWAGDRLVFVGDDANGVPRNCKDYKEVWHKSGLFERDQQLDEEFGIERDQDDLDSAAKNPLYFGVPFMLAEREKLEELFENSSDTQLLLRLSAMLRRHPDSKRPGVLRNLSKKMYILDSKLAEARNSFSLGEAIMIRTLWSQYYTDISGFDDWTGDRFDIRSAEHIPEEWADWSNHTIQILQIREEIRELRNIDEEDLRSWVE